MVLLDAVHSLVEVCDLGFGAEHLSPQNVSYPTLNLTYQLWPEELRCPAKTTHFEGPYRQNYAHYNEPKIESLLGCSG